jgi:fucose permease
MKLNYRHTRYACYTGYITQAIVNNLAPLFFIIFSDSYSVSYRGLGFLVMLNFMVQLAVDSACSKFASRIGYKPLLIAAQAISTLGLLCLGLLPLFVTPVYLALVVSVVVYAIGGGLLEVLVSPVVDSLPGEAEQKPAAMSLLHSFYCWGQMAVILLTTFLLSRFGLENWFILPLLWAVIPFANMFLFMKVPIVEAWPEKEAMGIKRMAKQPVFFLCLIMMLCAGASEQSVAQWASFFAEKALNLPKVMGDIFGPALFALFMGIGRMIYGLWGAKIKLFNYMFFSGTLCVICYLGITMAPHPLIQLAACALTGFSISIMWPAVFSLSSARFPAGGAPLFALLALMGDMGCGSGPWIAGLVSNAAESGGIFRNLSLLLSGGGDVPLKAGILVCIVFPVVFLVCLLLFRRERRD